MKHEELKAIRDKLSVAGKYTPVCKNEKTAGPVTPWDIKGLVIKGGE